MASQNGDVGQVERYLNSSSQHSHQTLMAALMVACQNGHSDVVKLIIQDGTSVDLNNKDQPALIVASQNGHSEVVDILISHGAQVNLQDNVGMSSLMIASQNGYHDITIMLLLQHGVQINLRNTDGWSAVMLASWNCHIKTVETLLKYGAQIDRDFVAKLLSLIHI